MAAAGGLALPAVPALPAASPGVARTRRAGRGGRAGLPPPVTAASAGRGGKAGRAAPGDGAPASRRRRLPQPRPGCRLPRRPRSAPAAAPPRTCRRSRGAQPAGKRPGPRRHAAAAARGVTGPEVGTGRGGRRARFARREPQAFRGREGKGADGGGVLMRHGAVNLAVRHKRREAAGSFQIPSLISVLSVRMTGELRRMHFNNL